MGDTHPLSFGPRWPWHPVFSRRTLRTLQDAQEVVSGGGTPWCWQARSYGHRARLPLGHPTPTSGPGVPGTPSLPGSPGGPGRSVLFIPNRPGSPGKPGTPGGPGGPGGPRGPCKRRRGRWPKVSLAPCPEEGSHTHPHGLQVAAKPGALHVNERLGEKSRGSTGTGVPRRAGLLPQGIPTPCPIAVPCPQSTYQPVLLGGGSRWSGGTWQSWGAPWPHTGVTLEWRRERGLQAQPGHPLHHGHGHSTHTVTHLLPLHPGLSWGAGEPLGPHHALQRGAQRVGEVQGRPSPAAPLCPPYLRVCRPRRGHPRDGKGERSAGCAGKKGGAAPSLPPGEGLPELGAQLTGSPSLPGGPSFPGSPGGPEGPGGPVTGSSTAPSLCREGGPGSPGSPFWPLEPG